jgi:hypothetical protein
MTDNVTPMPRSELVDLRKARNWIARWKKAQGGFTVHEGIQGIIVQIARTPDPDPEADAVLAKKAGALETELRANPNTPRLVCALVREAWQQMQAPRPANDSEPEPPEAA